jgi:TM2 domain-containing membrane protein YozV
MFSLSGFYVRWRSICSLSEINMDEAQQAAVQEKAADEVFCTSCGAVIKQMAEICPRCGVRQRSAPAPVVNVSVVSPAGNNVEKSSRSWVVLLLLSLFLGGVGVDRMYVGKYGTGLLKFGLNIVGFLTTFIFIGFLILPVVWIWMLVDFILIVCGKFTDKEGRLVKI